MLLGSVSVSAEGGAGDPSGPRGAQRYPVPAEVHPGGKSSLPVMRRLSPARSVPGKCWQDHYKLFILQLYMYMVLAYIKYIYVRDNFKFHLNRLMHS